MPFKQSRAVGIIRFTAQANRGAQPHQADDSPGVFARLAEQPASTRRVAFPFLRDAAPLSTSTLRRTVNCLLADASRRTAQTPTVSAVRADSKKLLREMTAEYRHLLALEAAGGLSR